MRESVPSNVSTKTSALSHYEVLIALVNRVSLAISLMPVNKTYQSFLSVSFHFIRYGKLASYVKLISSIAITTAID